MVCFYCDRASMMALRELKCWCSQLTPSVILPEVMFLTHMAPGRLLYERCWGGVCVLAHVCMREKARGRGSTYHTLFSSLTCWVTLRLLLFTIVSSEALVTLTSIVQTTCIIGLASPMVIAGLNLTDMVTCRCEKSKRSNARK